MAWEENRARGLQAVVEVHSFCYKNIVFPAQDEYSYFSADLRLKIIL